jgi:hypothetical protein
MGYQLTASPGARVSQATDQLGQHIIWDGYEN